MGGLAVLQKGEGENLVFMHGYLACKETFNYQIEYLSKFFKVTAFDFRGMGQSEALESAFCVDDYADETERLMHSLGIERAHFIAHSFGGRVALKLAARQKGLIDKLILTGCAGLKPKFCLKKFLRIRLYKILKRFIRREKLDKKFGSSDYRQLSPIMKQSFIKIVNEDLKPCLNKINAQTLLIFGENDTETPLYMARRLSKGIAGSGLVVLNGAGHFSFIDKSYDFNIISKEFLTGNG